MTLYFDQDEFEAQPLDFSRGERFPVGDGRVVAFLDSLSKKILSDPSSIKFPDLATFGFFCRKSNIKRQIALTQRSEQRVGLGLVAHIAPGNIPINFAFSMVMGLVSGNSNFIRLPTYPFPQVTLLLELIEQLLSVSEHGFLREKILFFRSTRRSGRLEHLVGLSDGLVVWGGDPTVEYFQSLKKLPNARELYFPSKNSSVVISASAFLALDPGSRQLFVERFYNDTFVVDQNACSSPSVVFWVGEPKDFDRARGLFWPNLRDYSYERYFAPGAPVLDKMLDVFSLIERLKTPVNFTNYSNLIWTSLDTRVAEGKLRHGNFLEISILQVGDLFAHLRSNEQTLSYFGVDPEELMRNILAKPQVKVERICRVGRALDMGLNWDGKDTIPILSRLVLMD